MDFLRPYQDCVFVIELQAISWILKSLSAIVSVVAQRAKSDLSPIALAKGEVGRRVLATVDEI